MRDWEISINYGIKTGFNDAFIIDSAKREQILTNCKTNEERERTAAIIRPILRGRDIARYTYNWADLWLINTHNGIKGSLNRIHIEDYPAIKQHLDFYWDKIKQRADKGDTPYNLRNCAYVDDFDKTKIVWIELSDESKFTICDNYIPLNTVFFLTGSHLSHILGLLNSKLINWYFRNCIGTSSGAGTNRWLKYTVELLPLLSYDSEIETLVNSRLTSDSDQVSLELQIDKVVCKKYGLTDEETEFILEN